MVVSRLFHTVVVVGAGIGMGCGGQSNTTADRPSDEALPPVVLAEDGGVLERPDVFWPNECASYAQFRCDRYSPLEGCGCDETAPNGPDDCGGNARFFCDAFVCPPGDTCTQRNNVDCECRADAPLAPEDCPGGPGQFECKYDDPRESCSCNPERPGHPESCTPTDAFVCLAYAPVYTTCQCNPSFEDEASCLANEYCSYECFSETPRYGCLCDCITPIR
jgi:hypothetical protein